jgi:hypothetical protein
MTSRQRSVICSHPAGELVVPSRKCWRRPSSLRQMASSCQSAGKPACWSCKRDYRNRPGFVRKLAACRIPKDRRSRRTRCGRGAAPSREWRAECQGYPELARGAVVSTRRWSAWPSPAAGSAACGSPASIGRRGAVIPAAMNSPLAGPPLGHPTVAARIFLLGAAGEQEENGLGASASGPART